ncbi:hypothetical protein J7M22_14655 [Candidatus Poribacteria bacterium]|nr:hypothetical protein [Candidatus Poribacteria bacterium]
MITLLLTTLFLSSQTYQRLEPGVWYLRITNPPGTGHKLCVRVYFNPNRPPWWGDVLYLARDGEYGEPPPKGRWINPGERSDWVDLGPHMSRSPLFSGSPCYLSPVFLGAMTAPSSDVLHIIVEIARGEDKRLARRIEIQDPHPTFIGYSTWLGRPPKLPTLGLLIPVDPSISERVYTLEEAAEQQLKWIESYGEHPGMPEKIHFICHQAQIAFENPTRLQRMQTEILRRLGYNNLTQYASDRRDIEAIEALGVKPIPAKIVGRGDLARVSDELKRSGLWDYVRFVNFGDEIELSLSMSPEEQDAAFVSYLRERSFDPLDFVRPEDEEAAKAVPPEERWRFVHLGGPLPPEKPKLFYEAAVFRYRLWTRELSRITEQARRCLPAGVQTGANYSPHLSVWPDVRKWIDMFRDGGMTMPWSEDWWWQVPEPTPQSYGFLLDALRHAADYYNSPFCFYTIPDPGETAEHFLRMNYFALGHQAKVIDHFCIYHQAFGTCDYIDFYMSKDTFRAIHRITGDVKRIDERLYQARMRPADVAILLSIASDVWDTEDLLADPQQKHDDRLYWAQLNVDNHERKAIWLALRHAQYPVDLITDEDIVDGMLDRYKVLYMVGQELLEDAVPNLVRWVQNGGVLVAEGGGGLLNQYRLPIKRMYELYGLREARLERPIRSIRPKSDLPGMKPLDTIYLSGELSETLERLPVLCYKHILIPSSEAQVVGRYDDGSAACIIHQVGKGRTLLLGGLMGLAYLCPAMIRRGGDLPENFPEDVRRFITWPLRRADVRRYVVTSDPLVEATLQEGPCGPIVTLISFRSKPVSVSVRLIGLPQATSVLSVRRGPLPIRRKEGIPEVELVVDQGDFLVVD